MILRRKAERGRGRLERPHPTQFVARPHAKVAVGIGVSLLSIAVLGIASSNVGDLVANHPVDLAIVTLTPVELLVAAVLGTALVRRTVVDTSSSARGRLTR